MDFLVSRQLVNDCRWHGYAMRLVQVDEDIVITCVEAE